MNQCSKFSYITEYTSYFLFPFVLCSGTLWFISLWLQSLLTVLCFIIVKSYASFSYALIVFYELMYVNNMVDVAFACSSSVFGDKV